MLDIKVVGEKKLIRKFEEIAKNNPGKLLRTMKKAVFMIRRDVVEKKLSGQVLNVQTGTLRRSITGKVEKKGTDIIGKVGTNVKYGRLWEKGGTIRAHRIEPVKAEALHFFYKGAEIFCKSANIPARKVKPRPFLAPVIKEKTPAIMEMFRKVAIEGMK